MRGQLAETVAGFVVIAIAAAFLIYSLGLSEGGGGSGYELRARFPAVDGLRVGTDVRLSGVRVGSVTEIELDPQTFEAQVRLSLRDDVSLPTDSSLSFRNEGLLGGLYLSIEPGGDIENLAAGDEFMFVQGPIDVVRVLMQLVGNSTDG